MSDHFVAKLQSDLAGPRYNNIKDLHFEVQVRTIAMDAWATISHYLDYKNEASIPTELKRDFFAVSGLFYVADSHFELFFKSAEESGRQSQQSIENREEFGEKEINLDNFSAYLAVRFPTREKSGPEEISSLVDDLKRSGYQQMKEIEKMVELGLDVFENLERIAPPMDGETGERTSYVNVGVIRVLFRIGEKKDTDDFERRLEKSNESTREYKKYQNGYKNFRKTIQRP